MKDEKAMNSCADKTVRSHRVYLRTSHANGLTGHKHCEQPEYEWNQPDDPSERIEKLFAHYLAYPAGHGVVGDQHIGLHAASRTVPVDGHFNSGQNRALAQTHFASHVPNRRASFLRTKSID